MKKFLCAGLSALTAVLTFVFLSIPCLTYSLGDKTMEQYSGWQIMSDYTDKIDGYMLYKIFAIVTIVFACLLVIMAIVLLLQQLKVIKTKLNLCMINSILLVLYTVFALVAMIGAVKLGKELSFAKSTFNVSFGLIFPWIIGIVASIISFVFSFKKSK